MKRRFERKWEERKTVSRKGVLFQSFAGKGAEKSSRYRGVDSQSCF